MKTISVKLTCKTCTNTFTHTKSVKGDGNSYKYWAMRNITQCPRCFSEERRKERTEWAVDYLYDHCVELPELNGTPNQIKYAERLRGDFISKYYFEIIKTVEKYNADKNALRIEAQEKGITTIQAALQKWEGTREYFLFASVSITSAGFLINMFTDKGIDCVA